MESLAIRELNIDEIEEVNGGFVPVLAFAGALASHVGIGGAAASLTGHLLSGFALGAATYSLAEYLS